MERIELVNTLVIQVGPAGLVTRAVAEICARFAVRRADLSRLQLFTTADWEAEPWLVGQTTHQLPDCCSFITISAYYLLQNMSTS